MVFSDKKKLYLNGGIARYNIYETKDKKHIALGALEDKFWKKFCSLINASADIVLEKLPQDKLISKVQKIIKEKNEVYWKKKFDKENDVCCTTINNLDDFMSDKHIKGKKLFDNKIIISNKKLSLVPTALDNALTKVKKINKAPKLGENNNLMEK